MARWKIGLIAIVLVATAGPVRPAQADKVGLRVAGLLEEFGFRFIGDRSTLRQGFSITGSRQFNNTQFDFGMVSLTLNGPLSFQFEAAKRLGPSVEFGLSTLNQPLTYALNINTGFQDFTATGALLINSSMEINPFGFYDLNLSVSNRGRFDADGFLLVDSGTLDYDIGPINASGNVFIDALAVLAEPFFVAINQPNPLAKISGRATKETIVDDIVDGIEAKVDADLPLVDEDMQALIDATIVASILGLDVPDLSFLQDADLEQLTTTTTDDGAILFGDGSGGRLTVPEPSVAILMLGPIIAWTGIRRRRRMSCD